MARSFVDSVPWQTSSQCPGPRKRSSATSSSSAAAWAAVPRPSAPPASGTRSASPRRTPGSAASARPRASRPSTSIGTSSAAAPPPACKNLGVTHMTNGCYRCIPSSGTSARRPGPCPPSASAAPSSREPSSTAGLLRAFQRQLLDAGVPLYWYDDLPNDHRAFAAGQLLALEGLWPGAEDHLHFEPDRLLSAAEANAVLREAGLSADRGDPVTRADLAGGWRTGASARHGEILPPPWCGAAAGRSWPVYLR